MGKRICSVEDCERPVKTMGRCSGHAERFRLKGIDGGPLAEYNPRPVNCVVDDCDCTVRAKGLCASHYQRMWSGSARTGSIGRPGRPRVPRIEQPCRGCGRIVERERRRLWVLCADCARKPAKPRRRYYGKTWRLATAAVRERDGGLCRSCGRTEQEEGRRLATAHIVPFDVGLSLGWAESRLHHLTNLVLLCAACHKAFDRRPGWAYDTEFGTRPNPPEWALDFRVVDLVDLAVEHYPALVRETLEKNGVAHVEV
jgi:hypothetical protein